MPAVRGGASVLAFAPDGKALAGAGTQSSPGVSVWDVATGVPRDVMLGHDDAVRTIVYSRDGDRYVIVASKGGAPTNPHWFHNLMAHPHVSVEVDGEKFAAHARIVDEHEYERLYEHHATKNPTFHDYRKKTTRKIPVVLLERV